jgi:hypothetical protein
MLPPSSGTKNNPSKKLSESRWLLHTDFFVLEEGDEIILQNDS